MSFKNKIVIVTGSSAGIGLATAKLYLQKGAKVIINGASLLGEKVCAELEKDFPGNVAFIRADVAKIAECKYLFDKTIELFGDVDILVNCAGIVPVGTILDFSEEQYDKAMNINVKSTFFLTQIVIEHMLKKKQGNIVNVGSIAGVIGPKNRALYATTKGAVISLTRALASDYASTGVRINCVCPGMVYSPSLEKRINDTPNPEETRNNFAQGIPVKRIGTAIEVAETIVFVSSDENSYMTGSIINVDGGASL